MLSYDVNVAAVQIAFAIAAVAAMFSLPTLCVWVLCILVTRKFKGDPSSPCVLVSRIHANHWYASVNRFTEACGKGKQTICKANSQSYMLITFLLAWQWLKHCRYEKPAVDWLTEFAFSQRLKTVLDTETTRLDANLWKYNPWKKADFSGIEMQGR